QASTVLMLATGAALLAAPTDQSVAEFFDELQTEMAKKYDSNLQKLIEHESQIYLENEVTLYTAHDYAICVLTDLTERAPTFSILPFENFSEAQPKASLSYLYIPGSQNSLAAWTNILDRPPRALTWPNIKDRYGEQALLGFDFSEQGKKKRE